MSAMFLEKAFWGFLALVAALITVIYRLFSVSLGKDLEIQKIKIKEELIHHVEIKFSEQNGIYEKRYLKLNEEIDSLKTTISASSKDQTSLLEKILHSIDR